MTVATTIPRTLVTRRPRLAWPIVVVLLLGLLTTTPYLYAAWTAPHDRSYTGLMLDAPDTLQYFSWMRDHRTALLVPNRMTSQPNHPALFNLLWLMLAQIQVLTGWSNAAIFQVLRLLGGGAFGWVLWWFTGLVMRSRREQGWAWMLAMCGGGLGVVWVVEKYVRGLPDVRYPSDLYVAEPNTLLSLLSYPHFLVAGALIVAVFGCALRAVQGSWRWWMAAAGAALVLALQHAYDLLTIYAVLGAWLCLLALRQRTIPWRAFGGVVLVGLVSFPPAGYFAWLTSRDPLWQAVLSQFPNAGVWTPNPLHLIVLMGLPLLLAVIFWDGFRPLPGRSDGELLVKAWCIAGFALIYLPVSFQIHLLNPWQVPLALAAIWGVERRLGPWVERRWRHRANWLLSLVVLLALPTNLYLLGWRFVELSRHSAPYFLHQDEAAALDWLATNTTRADVVLSDLNLGQFVAAETDARAVLAHWAQTVAFYDTTADVKTVLVPATTSAVRSSILQKYSVSLVVAPGPLEDTALKLVWEGARTPLKIYAVELKRAHAPPTTERFTP